jgi:Holliday junction resolvase RusA-like endonuclease
MRKQKLSVFAGQAVTVICNFYFDKPKSTKKSVRNKITKPDVDKLSRTVLDGLTGTVFKDDAQVVLLRSGKEFSDRPRAEIQVDIEETP